MKQAKEEAQEEIEKYRLERDRQFKEFEAKVNDRSKTHLVMFNGNSRLSMILNQTEQIFMKRFCI